MPNITRILTELKQLESEYITMQRKLNILIMELEGNTTGNKTINKEINVFNEIISQYFKLNDPFNYTKQQEMFKHIKENLPNNKQLLTKCQELGWNDKPSNTFWRKFWQYVSTLPEIHRVVKSKNDIRYYGLSLQCRINNN